MSKNKKKNKPSKGMKKYSNSIPKPKQHNTKTLYKKLNDIYNSVNLETTCKGRTECCKVAMPQMNNCEFTQIINNIWNNRSKGEKIALVCKSIEYFFKNEFEKFGTETLIKPCMLLGEDGLCSEYDGRPLSCRLYGLWPYETYKARVDKFAKAFEGLLERDELPLHTQCPFVNRVDDSDPLTDEVINGLFSKLDQLDIAIGDFTEAQVSQKENYRTFHDWLLLKVFGEERLSALTSFMIAADKKLLNEQIDALSEVIKSKFSKDMPSI